MLDLSILIVSWNVKSLLASCLESIYASVDVPTNARASRLSIEVIVVDSASSDGTQDMLRARFPSVRMLAQPSNVGFTRGSNIALEAATGRNLLLLNPDTEIIGDALSQMVQFLDAHPDVGIVGPNTRNSDGSYQSTRRQFPTPALAFFESTWLESYAPKRMLNRYYVRDASEVATLDVDWVQGSALLARREIYTQIGGLDEGYIMFSEELDWCKRAKMAGWRVVYLGDAKIIHHGGKSTEQVIARKHIHFQQSKLRYFRKFHGRIVARPLRVYLLASYAFQWLLEAVKAAVGHKRSLRRLRMDAYAQVLRSGLKVY